MHPRTEIGSALLPPAFVPAPKVKQDLRETLASIYGEEKPYYPGADMPGTLAANTEFTAAQKENAECYRRQIHALTNEILRDATKYHLTDYHLESLDLFKVQLTRWDYYKDQSVEFYRFVKESLESIIHALKNTYQKTECVETIIQDWLHNVALCGPGVGRNYSFAVESLLPSHSIARWLAKYRELLLRQIAETFVAEKGIDDGEAIHAINIIFNYGCDQHWNPIGHETRKIINETFAKNAQLTADDLLRAHDVFLTRYTPEAIVDEITSTLHLELSNRLKKRSPAPIVRSDR
jgi:hypothetical protein